MIAVQVQEDDSTWTTVASYGDHSPDLAELYKEHLQRNDTAGNYRTRKV